MHSVQQQQEPIVKHKGGLVKISNKLIRVDHFKNNTVPDKSLYCSRALLNLNGPFE